MKFRAWAASLWSDEEDAESGRRRERRAEPRHDCCGLKIIIRERRSLSILHLRNLSTWGASGMTDMPLPVGSLVFLELTKSHYYGARVKWVNRTTLGLQLCRPMRPEILAGLLSRAKQRGKGRDLHPAKAG
jgi:hypothetical protein